MHARGAKATEKRGDGEVGSSSEASKGSVATKADMSAFRPDATPRDLASRDRIHVSRNDAPNAKNLCMTP